MDERNNNFDFDFTPIGQAIKKAREARGMTREQLSGIIGYAPRHIQSIENEGQYPSIELFIQLITMFDVSVDEYIFPDNEVKKSSVRRRLDAQLDNLDDKELSVTLKPICTVHAACEFWDNPAFDITTLVGTPRYEAGTPFHTPIKAIPTPIRLTALISELCQSDLHNRLVTAACERPPVWIIQQHMGGILRVAIAVPT